MRNEAVFDCVTSGRTVHDLIIAKTETICVVFTIEPNVASLLHMGIDGTTESQPIEIQHTRCWVHRELVVCPMYMWQYLFPIRVMDPPLLHEMYNARATSPLRCSWNG